MADAVQKPRWSRAAIVLAAAGATLGAALDAIHTHSGTTEYTHPVFLKMAWWVPPLFAGAAISIGLARPIWEHVLERRTPRPPAWSVVAGMILFIAAYFCSGFLPFDTTGRMVALVALFVATWGICDRSPLGLFLAGSTALLGTSVEIALVRLDLFLYLHPSLSVVTAWLPWLYASAAVGVGNFGKWLVEPDVSAGTPTSPA